MSPVPALYGLGGGIRDVLDPQGLTGVGPGDGDPQVRLKMPRLLIRLCCLS